MGAQEAQVQDLSVRTPPVRTPAARTVLTGVQLAGRSRCTSGNPHPRVRQLLLQVPHHLPRLTPRRLQGMLPLLLLLCQRRALLPAQQLQLLMLQLPAQWHYRPQHMICHVKQQLQGNSACRTRWLLPRLRQQLGSLP